MRLASFLLDIYTIDKNWKEQSHVKNRKFYRPFFKKKHIKYDMVSLIKIVYLPLRVIDIILKEDVNDCSARIMWNWPLSIPGESKGKMKTLDK